MRLKFSALTALLCALLLAALACSSRSGNENGSSAPAAGGGTVSGGGAAAAISPDENPLDVMSKAMRSQLDARSFRAHIDSTAGDGTSSTSVVEYVAPDRYRMVVEAKTGGQNVKLEYLVVGGATYIKGPGGRWVKTPVDAGALIRGFRDPKMLDELRKTTDIKFAGRDTLGGEPMLVYEYTQTNPLGMKMKATSKTWLSAADGLPRKTETEGELDGKKTQTVVTISDYNADIKIEAPGN
ncbi:MAG TPA: hypothetical protein VK421_00705 [Pyrinomonadaceae bacterium]|nr:hypothetical protein [Pyrinomonadaceae bacterium]